MLTSHPIYTKPALVALRLSYGVAASPSQAARAAALAPSVRAIRPGVYQVGASVCDLWRESCSCKQARSAAIRGRRQADSPCVHYLALYLAREWSPIYNSVDYLRSVEVEQPEIIEYHCRAHLPTCYPPAPRGYLILEVSDGWATLQNISTGTHASAQVESLHHVQPVYEAL